MVDSVMIPDLREIRREGFACPRFKHDLEQYLASLGDDAPVTTLAEIIASRDFHPSIHRSLEFFEASGVVPDSSERCARTEANRERFRAAVRAQLERHDLDAMIYPTWSNPPRLIGDLNTPHGDNSQELSPHTGFPAITVPMGFVRDSLPVGLQFFGEAWSEPTLIGLAYAYEQAGDAAPGTAPGHARAQPVGAAPDAGAAGLFRWGRSFRYTLPSFITNTTRRRAVMSSSGLPATAIRSARMPASITPRSSSPIDSAASDVAETMASIGSWPPVSTR